MDEWYTNPLVWIGVLSSVSVMVGTIFWLGQWKGRVDADWSALRKDIDSDRSTVREFMAEIRADIKRIHADITRIHADITRNRADITRLFERLPPPEPVASGSPLRLTTLGQSMSDELGVSAWATETAPNLLHRAQGMTAYKVQEMCFEYARNEWKPSDEWDARIDACACSRGMERKSVLDVFAVELRDRLLTQLGIPVE